MLLFFILYYLTHKIYIYIFLLKKKYKIIVIYYKIQIFYQKISKLIILSKFKAIKFILLLLLFLK